MHHCQRSSPSHVVRGEFYQEQPSMPVSPGFAPEFHFHVGSLSCVDSLLHPIHFYTAFPHESVRDVILITQKSVCGRFHIIL